MTEIDLMRENMSDLLIAEHFQKEAKKDKAEIAELKKRVNNQKATIIRMEDKPLIAENAELKELLGAMYNHNATHEQEERMVELLTKKDDE